MLTDVGKPRISASPNEADLYSALAITPMFYRAALEPDFWPVVLERLIVEFDAKAAQINTTNVHPLEVTASYTVGVDPDQVERWMAIEDHAVVDPRTAVFALPNRVLRDIDVVSEDTWHASEMYQNYMVPSGLDFTIGYVADLEDTFAVLAIMRGSGEPAFSEADVDKLNLYVPHFRQAVTVAGAVRTHSEIAQSLSLVFDGLRTPVFVTTQRARIVYRNTRAGNLIANDFPLVDQDGLLGTDNLNTTGMLRALIYEAVEESPANSRTKRVLHLGSSSSSLPVVAAVGAVRGESDTGPGYSVVFIIDPGKKIETDLEVLQRIFGLTPREAEVMSQIGHGNNLREIANSLGLGYETAKTHLKSVYAKTGVSSQSEIVRLGTIIGSV